MNGNQNKISVNWAVALPLIILSAIAMEQGLVSDPKWYEVLYVTIPLLLVLIVASFIKAQKQNNL